MTEREYKPRVKKYQIKQLQETFIDFSGIRKQVSAFTRNGVIARWDKKRGLLWRVAPCFYGADPVDSVDSAYWKVTEGSRAGVHSAIKQVGEYLSAGEINPDDAHELLDLLNRALAGILDS
jgi:hypothetical protein